jgi:thiol:disulfide interchange protein DsbD
MIRIRILAFFAAWIFASFSAWGYDPLQALKDDVGKTKKDESTWRFLSECKSIAPGQTFSVALALSHPEEWHSYYVNPGGPEQSPRIEWQLPSGFQVGKIQWPAPHVNQPLYQLDEANRTFSYQYSKDDAFLIFDITAPNDLQPGAKVELRGEAKWQICKDVCKDESAKLDISLPVAAASESDPAVADDFKNARNRHGAASDLEFSFEKRGNKLQLVIQGEESLEDAHFISNHPMVMSSQAQKAVKTDGTWVIDLQTQRKDSLDNPIPATDTLGGFLQFTKQGKLTAVRVPDSPITKTISWAEFMPVLFGMFIGGMILNLMPCVFPVLGIKILGFVQQAGSDRKKILLHGLMFAVGVLVSFWVLSGILYVARSSISGGADGWGFQLQNKWVVYSLMMLMYVMALNLAGVFEIGNSATSIGGKLQTKQGMSGSFFSGLLATVVATPCSGPFLGPAIGAAIGLPAVQFFTAFTIMGIGLALPYVMLSAFPKFVNYLPRPGAWMESFKQAMSFLLFGSAAFLLWVYGGIIDYDNLLSPLIGLTLIAIACWIYGRWCTFHRSRTSKIVAASTALVFLLSGMFVSGSIKHGLDWQAWSADTVEELLSEDRPVFVDFTAKWCATCQVNKRLAYDDEVVKLFAERGIVALKADKTKPSPQIEKALAELDRSAIPVNVLYIPGKDPIITPANLTPGYMKELIEQNTKKPEK